MHNLSWTGFEIFLFHIFWHTFTMQYLQSFLLQIKMAPLLPSKDMPPAIL